MIIEQQEEIRRLQLIISTQHQQEQPIATEIAMFAAP